jgi:hypothetical protein
VTANDWICVDGNEAAARLAYRLSEVIAIYPITPARPPPTTRPAAERVDVAFLLAVAAILAFAFTNGFHDAANAIATLVATRAPRRGRPSSWPRPATCSARYCRRPWPTRSPASSG